MANILVVDDELSVQNALRRLLRRAGHQVQTASGGAEALQRLETFPADVVLSDVCMPEMSGLALLEEVRRRRPSTGCVLLTAYADGRTFRRAAEANLPLLEKPWDDAELLATLEAHLPAPSPVTQAR